MDEDIWIIEGNKVYQVLPEERLKIHWCWTREPDSPRDVLDRYQAYEVKPFEGCILADEAYWDEQFEIQWEVERGTPTAPHVRLPDDAT